MVEKRHNHWDHPNRGQQLMTGSGAVGLKMQSRKDVARSVPVCRQVSLANLLT